MGAHYWLLDWIDQKEIRSREDARRALRAKSGVASFLERARADKEQAFPRADTFHQLLAGPSMDLSGYLECHNPACMTANVEQLLRKAILYFDKVIVTGLEPTRAMRLGSRGAALLEREALTHIEVALNIRKMGAEDALLFSPKVDLCTSHLNQHALEAGMSPVEDQVRQLTDYIAAGGTFKEFKWKRNQLYTVYSHPALGADMIWAGTRKVKPGERPTPASELTRVAEEIARTRVGELIRSAASASISQAALGMTSDLPGGSQIAMQPSTSIEQVALSIPLPINDAIPIRDLLLLREQETSAFQFALRRAIKEQLSADSAADPAVVAREVMADVVEPALVAIDRRVENASEVAYRTAGASVGVGLTMLTVGLVALAPVVVPGLVIAASGLALSAREHIKAQAEVKLEDMYFLWRATKPSTGHAASHA